MSQPYPAIILGSSRGASIDFYSKLSFEMMCRIPHIHADVERETSGNLRFSTLTVANDTKKGGILSLQSVETFASNNSFRCFDVVESFDKNAVYVAGFVHNCAFSLKSWFKPDGFAQAIEGPIVQISYNEVEIIHNVSLTALFPALAEPADPLERKETCAIL